MSRMSARLPWRRNNNKNMNSGIKDSTKKMGPPRRWIMLSLICGPTYTQSSPMTRIRNPFLTIASGITNVSSANLRHVLLRKRWDARTLVMKSTTVERIPLHSRATSSTIPGSVNIVPWRKSGVPVILKNKAAASADAATNASSSQATAASGNGIMNNKNAIGKTAAAMRFEPRNRNPPATMKLT